MEIRTKPETERFQEVLAVKMRSSGLREKDNTRTPRAPLLHGMSVLFGDKPHG